jgi:hypothetical protein
MGIGPLLVGMLSDSLMPLLGADSLRYAMLIMSFVALWAGCHFWMVGRTVQVDLSTAANAMLSHSDSKGFQGTLHQPALTK